MERNLCLGSVVSQLLQAPVPDPQAQMKIWDRIAQQNGYRNFTHVMALVEQRTCSRWIYFHLLK